MAKFVVNVRITANCADAAAAQATADELRALLKTSYVQMLLAARGVTGWTIEKPQKANG